MNHRNNGFALVLVMILVAVAVILGVSYLSVASLGLQVSKNYQAMARARYLAESGLQHGLCELRYRPNGLVGCNVAVRDVQGEGYTVTATRDDATGLYTVASTAMAGGVTRTCAANVQRQPGPMRRSDHGLMVGAGLAWLPGGVHMTGDFHINGSLQNQAFIDGNATACGLLWDTLGRITGDAQGGVAPVSLPVINVNQYVTYNLDGQNCQATQYTRTTMQSNDPLANGGAVTAANPGGVVRCIPNDGSGIVILQNNLKFRGTLIIEGDVKIDGAGIELESVEGFPAIVATGSVLVTNCASNCTINGVVAAASGIAPGTPQTDGSSVAFNGAIVSTLRGISSALQGTYQIQYQQKFATLYDFTVPIDQRTPQVTMLNWSD